MILNKHTGPWSGLTSV